MRWTWIMAVVLAVAVIGDADACRRGRHRGGRRGGCHSTNVSGARGCATCAAPGGGTTCAATPQQPWQPSVVAGQPALTDPATGETYVRGNDGVYRLQTPAPALIAGR